MDGATAVSNILEHVGVKGMKWGVRRKATVQPREIVIRDTRKKLKISGGQGRLASPDAVRARTIGQVGKKSGLKALSDNDLRTYTNRLNMEANVRRLEYGEKNVAKRAVARMLGKSGNVQAQDQAVTNMGKKVVKAAVTAAAA